MLCPGYEAEMVKDDSVTYRWWASNELILRGASDIELLGSDVTITWLVPAS